jgi:hypothetical protein
VSPSVQEAMRSCDNEGPAAARFDGFQECEKLQTRAESAGQPGRVHMPAAG